MSNQSEEVRNVCSRNERSSRSPSPTKYRFPGILLAPKDGQYFAYIFVVDEIAVVRCSTSHWTPGDIVKCTYTTSNFPKFPDIRFEVEKIEETEYPWRIDSRLQDGKLAILVKINLKWKEVDHYGGPNKYFVEEMGKTRLRCRSTVVFGIEDSIAYAWCRLEKYPVFGDPYVRSHFIWTIFGVEKIEKTIQAVESQIQDANVTLDSLSFSKRCTNHLLQKGQRVIDFLLDDSGLTKDQKTQFEKIKALHESAIDKFNT